MLGPSEEMWDLGSHCPALRVALSRAANSLPMPTKPLLFSAQFAPELTAAEVKAGLEILDSNKDGQIQLGEFVEWWLKARK